MSPSNAKAIVEFAPALFRLPRQDLGHVGFEWFYCGDGWVDVLKKFARKANVQLRTMIDDGIDKDFLPVIKSVREIGGALVIDSLYSVSSFDALVHAAEREALSICELCGYPGKFVTRNLIGASVRCAKCEMNL